MWYPAEVTDDADVEPVTLPEAKKQVHAEHHTDDDTYLTALIVAARDHAERYTGTRIAQQIVTVKCDGFDDFDWLPVAPVESVTITYVDTAGATQTLADTVYELRADDLDASIVLKYGQTWPAIQMGSRITVLATVGYVTVPAALKHALLMFISDAFERREPAASGVRSTFDDLLANFRR